MVRLTLYCTPWRRGILWENAGFIGEMAWLGKGEYTYKKLLKTKYGRTWEVLPYFVMTARQNFGSYYYTNVQFMAKKGT